MHIFLYPLSKLYTDTQAILNTLTSTQKKILLLASVIFTLFCVIVYKYYGRTKKVVARTGQSATHAVQQAASAALPNKKAANSHPSSTKKGGAPDINTEKERLLQTIHADPRVVSVKEKAVAYCQLGMLLDSTATVTLKNGAVLSKKDLFLKAILLDKYLGEAYLQLGKILSDRNEVLDLELNCAIDLREKTELDMPAKPFDISHICVRATAEICFLKAIDLLPDSAEAYEALADSSNNLAKIHELLDKTTMTNEQLYLKALELDPDRVRIFIKLADQMTNHVEITLNGVKASQRDLYFMAMRLDPKNPLIYNKLARTLTQNGNITLPDGTVLSQMQLHIRAVENHSQVAQDYYEIANSLRSSNSVKINGQAWTKQQLYDMGNRF